MSVTQKDIAELAGVSYATVSRVINSPDSVKPRLAAKVYRAMHELGVEVENSGVTEQKRNSVLVVVDDFTYSLFSLLISGVSEALNEANLSMVLCNSKGEISVEKKYIENACREGYVGIIFVTANDTDEYHKMLEDISIPVVMLNRRLDSLNYDSVQLSHFDTAITAVHTLQKMGHRRIAFLTTEAESTNTRAEKIGFINALFETGISFSEAETHIYTAPLSYEGGSRFAEEFVSEKMDYTALYLIASEHCTGFVSRYQQLGYSIPDNLSIIVLNKVPFLIGSSITITTLEQPAEEMGKKSVELLLRRVQKPNSDKTNVQYNSVLKEGTSIKRLENLVY